jgi:hypothetical protein
MLSCIYTTSNKLEKLVNSVDGKQNIQQEIIHSVDLIYEGHTESHEQRRVVGNSAT